MRILSIESSADETGVAILEGTDAGEATSFTLLGNTLSSQVELHAQYGGIFPAMAKRAHAANIVPLLIAALEEAELLREDLQAIPGEVRTRIAGILEREPEMAEALFAFADEAEVPEIDAIAVTYGPGLEPALWVGVNLARALSILWDKPVVGVNHLEGHILVSLLTFETERQFTLTRPEFPMLSLVISGGHTELVVSEEAGTYTRIGETRDDAVGEAYDKVARMMGLPYPGGPQISKLADEAREADLPREFTLPRPMMNSNDADFSFSGLKTAVLYLIKAAGELSLDQKRMLALEFETAVADVLWKKAAYALEKTGAQSLAIGGGVSANRNIREVFGAHLKDTDISLHIPHPSHTGDNAIMIGIAGYFRAKEGAYVDIDTLRADGNLSLV